jgi:predicted metal-binding protein
MAEIKGKGGKVSGGGKKTVRAICTHVDEATLKADLERYRQEALQLGASEAEIVPAHWVQIDERVRLKCATPPCPNYGRCGNCPPYTPEPEFMRKAINRYDWALLFKIDVPTEDFADIGRYYPHGKEHQRKTDEIAAKVELKAFADGYRFAVGYGAGGCRDTMCNGGLCQMLDSGRCPYILMARPSMEAVGIDACDLASKVGWEIYPIYRSMDPKEVPSATSVGIVFIQ